MGKQYVIKLSPITVTRNVIVDLCPTCNRPREEKIEPLREMELEILTHLFNLASTTKKDIKSAMLCYDCISQLDNVADTDEKIEFTDEDLKLLDEGFELTSGTNHLGMIKRPFAWMEKCHGLFSQIKNPKTQEELDAEKKALEATIPPLEDNTPVPDSV